VISVLTAPSGTLFSPARLRDREPGSIPSRLSENITRVAVARTAIPHATNAESTTSSNGFSAHEPNASTTAGVTGSSTMNSATPTPAGGERGERDDRVQADDR
jgi:hypothetical protein